MALKKVDKKVEDKVTVVTKNKITGVETCTQQGVETTKELNVSNIGGIVGFELEKGATYNMDNYESARLSLRIKYQIKPNESLDGAIETVSNVIDKVLEEEAKLLQKN